MMQDSSSSYSSGEDHMPIRQLLLRNRRRHSTIYCPTSSCSDNFDGHCELDTGEFSRTSGEYWDDADDACSSNAYTFVHLKREAAAMEAHSKYRGNEEAQKGRKIPTEVMDTAGYNAGESGKHSTTAAERQIKDLRDRMSKAEDELQVLFRRRGKTYMRFEALSKA
ncbi:hypothetical protein CDL15_Pgr014445 [Punica granatum]|uniref:Uncharacterized protein n=1 Tax=Punica granatum TaxID=22663 RepID=A0A218WFD2_PUNGR|nr:hypothetical protein CDL15_Pgr014445 [Punica granatum]PKI41710.1 hypothetical protein CRG98_037912 [Punica granatum]